MTQCETTPTTRYSVLMGIALSMAVFASTGCKNIVNRAQSPDKPIPVGKSNSDDEESTTYISDQCSFWGVNYTAIEGISLATGLNGTGSNPNKSRQRELLAKELAARTEIDNARQLIADTDTEIILVRGMLPPGIRKGETYDIEVQALRDTEGTTIAGGTAIQCRLRPQTKVSRGVKQGHVKGLAKGNIIVDSAFSTRDDRSTSLRGIILGGGIAMADREMGLRVKSETLHPKTTTEIAWAINQRFTIVNREGKNGAAEPKTDRNVNLQVPDEYRLNVGRYLHVLRNLAFGESAQDRVNRMEQLEGDLAIPSQAERAALRLEGLGRDGHAALKRALQNEDPEIRFHAAQSLAYQNEPDGTEVLKLAAKDEPAFRALALTALATLDTAAATDALTELLHTPSAETRYGAFYSLRAKRSQSSLIAGQWIADRFFLHEIESSAEPMLHFSKAKRSEIVLFNDQQTVSSEFLHVSNGITIRASDDDTVQITRYRRDGSDQKRTCSTQVGDLITALSEIGFDYSDLLKIFREAKQNGTLNSRLVVNAMPRSDREYRPGQDGEQLPPERSEKYLAKAAPTLFRDSDDQKSIDSSLKPVPLPAADDDEPKAQRLPKLKKKVALTKPLEKVHRDSAVRKTSFWSKINPLNRKKK